MFKLTHIIALLTLIASNVFALAGFPAPSLIQSFENHSSEPSSSCKQVSRIDNNNSEGEDA